MKIKILVKDNTASHRDDRGSQCTIVPNRGVRGQRARNLLLTTLVISVIALAIAGFVYAQTTQELQDELNQLESELSGAGYDWLGIREVNKIFGSENERH